MFTISFTEKREAEIIFLLLSLYCTAAVYLWQFLGVPLPACPFHALFGIPCAACGMGRATEFLARGDMLHAFVLNPLFSVGVCLAVMFNLYVLIVLIFGLRVIRIRTTRAGANLLRITGVCCVLLNWSYLIYTGA